MNTRRVAVRCAAWLGLIRGHLWHFEFLPASFLLIEWNILGMCGYPPNVAAGVFDAAISLTGRHVIVITEEKRAELQERLRRLQEAQPAGEQIVTTMPVASQAQLPANAAATAPALTPSFATWRDSQPPEPKPSPRLFVLAQEDGGISE